MGSAARVGVDSGCVLPPFGQGVSFLGWVELQREFFKIQNIVSLHISGGTVKRKTIYQPLLKKLNLFNI